MLVIQVKEQKKKELTNKLCTEKINILTCALNVLHLHLIANISKSKIESLKYNQKSIV